MQRRRYNLYDSPALGDYALLGNIPAIERALEDDTELSEDGTYIIDEKDGEKNNALDYALIGRSVNAEEVVKLLLDEGIRITKYSLPYAIKNKADYDEPPRPRGSGDRIITLIREAKAEGRGRERAALLLRRAAEEEGEDEGEQIRQAEEEFDEIQAAAAARVAAATSEEGIASVPTSSEPEQGTENPPPNEEEPQPTVPKGGKRKTRKGRKTKKRTTRRVRRVSKKRAIPHKRQ